MIIYYHCTRDSALLLPFLLTCHPLSFHEMIFILVPPVFCIRRVALASLVMRMCNQKRRLTTPYVMASSPKYLVQVVDLPEFTMVVARRFY